MNIKLTEEKPTKAGVYATTDLDGTNPQIRVLFFGDWKAAQNPEWLYCGRNPSGTPIKEWTGKFWSEPLTFEKL